MEFETSGEIQNIRKDNKAIAILGNWYNSFKEIKDLKKGDNIKLIFTEKKLDNKVFKNIKSYELIEKTREQKEEIRKDIARANALDILNKSFKETELTATDKNCIIMTAKDLAITFKDIPMEQWVKEIKRLRLNI